MKSGNITQFQFLSQFKTVQQFNENMKQVHNKYGPIFTKSEKIALQILARFSVKHIGVCNARICKLVESAQTEKCGISRSTFERMLRKAKKLGILSVHHTIRKKGGFSHSVYVFHIFDGASIKKLTERYERANAATPTTEVEKTSLKTISIENKQKIKDLRPLELESLDYTYVPGYVPDQWTKTVKPFFTSAIEICQLWDRAIIAYRRKNLSYPIEDYLPIIIQAFKQTVFQYKRKKIKQSFYAYFFGTVDGMLTVEARREWAKENEDSNRFGRWLGVQ